MSKKATTLFTVITLFLLVPLACSKEAVSGPQFIFKPAPDQTTAAVVMGTKISNAELTKGLESEIYDLEVKIHELKMNRLRAMILENLMKADPKSKGMSNDDYLNKYIAKDVKVSKEAIAAFIKERKIPKEHLNEQMNARIRQFLERDEKRKAIDRWMGQKTAKSPIIVHLKKPQRPVYDVDAGDAPYMGANDAKVTIVEFSDFQCPFCAKGADVVNQLKKKYGDKIKVAFKNFPLPFHTHAAMAAEAGLCVHEQDKKKFWKMHDLMFADQSGLAKEGLIAKAKSLGVDEKKFNECLSSNRYKAKVAADIAQGKKVGVKSTPTFYVNGQLINGAQPVAVFSELIDQALSK